MSNFFDKVKKGVSDAGSKAKTLVDINKLKAQISQINKEIDEEYKNIGQLVFNSFKDEGIEDSDEKIGEKCNAIIKKLEDIDRINKEILRLTNERTCSCGASISMDAKFCPACGKKFEDIHENDSPKEESKVNICSQCNTKLEEGIKFCPNCGNPIK